MKITHLITSLEGGGTENFLCQLLKHSPKSVSHHVLFLKKDGVFGERIRALGIPVQAADAGTVWRALRADRPDVLHTCLYRAHQLGRVMGRLAGVPRIVSSQRAIDAWQMPWHVYLDGFTLQFCDDVIVNSSAAERLVRRRIGSHATPRVTRILNGVDLNRFKLQDRDTARRVLELPEGNTRIGGSLMRLHREKGADYILRFAKAALMKNPNLHLAVGGVGPLETTLHAASLKETWGHRLHWLGWVEDTPAFYAALDFFWSLSREESFPQSLLEASVMSIPWIAPEVGGVPDLIAAGAKGQLYPSGNIDQAAALVHELLQAFSVDKMASRFYSAIA
jgi:glycosyltransferase involved in cell wall biosynthesis